MLPYEQLELIRAHRNYYYDMLYFLEGLENVCAYFTEKKPSRDLSCLLDSSKKRSETLSGTDLHNYLVRNVVDAQIEISCPRVSDCKPTQFGDAVNFLKTGYEMIKRQNCSILRYYIDYGDWLNVAFELHYLDKLAGKVTFTWKDFIEREIGIQDSYARKLREIARLNILVLGNWGYLFQKFRNQIRNMLAIDDNLAAYWAQ